MYTIFNYICELPQDIQSTLLANAERLYSEEDIEMMLNEKLINVLDTSEEAERIGLTKERYIAILNNYRGW